MSCYYYSCIGGGCVCVCVCVCVLQRRWWWQRRQWRYTKLADATDEIADTLGLKGDDLRFKGYAKTLDETEGLDA